MTISTPDLSRFAASPIRQPQRVAQRQTFEKYLDADAQREIMQNLPKGESVGSVFMQFMEDYRAWKAQQPELDLPDSQGWTEENLAFLRDHYSGSLSAFEIYDALETMEAMGAISRKEKNYATGNQLIALDISDLNGGFHIGADPDSRSAWLNGFDQAPMVGFRSMDEILSWIEAFRSEEHPDFITHAEAAARGWL